MALFYHPPFSSFHLLKALLTKRSPETLLLHTLSLRNCFITLFTPFHVIYIFRCGCPGLAHRTQAGLWILLHGSLFVADSQDFWRRAVDGCSGALDNATVAQPRGTILIKDGSDLLHRWPPQACLYRHLDSTRTDWLYRQDPGMPCSGVVT